MASELGGLSDRSYAREARARLAVTLRVSHSSGVAREGSGEGFPLPREARAGERRLRRL